jgi:hypothetical protein
VLPCVDAPDSSKKLMFTINFNQTLQTYLCIMTTKLIQVMTYRTFRNPSTYIKERPHHLPTT